MTMLGALLGRETVQAGPLAQASPASCLRMLQEHALERRAGGGGAVYAGLFDWLADEPFLLLQPEHLEGVLGYFAADEARATAREALAALDAMQRPADEIFAELAGMLKDEQARARTRLVKRGLRVNFAAGRPVVDGAIESGLSADAGLLALLLLHPEDLRGAVDAQAFPPERCVPDAKRKARHAELTKELVAASSKLEELAKAAGRYTAHGFDRWLCHAYGAAFFNAHACAPCDHAGRALKDAKQAEVLKRLGIRNATQDGRLFRPTDENKLALLYGKE